MPDGCDNGTAAGGAGGLAFPFPLPEAGTLGFGASGMAADFGESGTDDDLDGARGMGADLGAPAPGMRDTGMTVGFTFTFPEGREPGLGGVDPVGVELDIKSPRLNPKSQI
jgi:hypothetical protein